MALSDERFRRKAVVNGSYIKVLDVAPFFKLTPNTQQLVVIQENPKHGEDQLVFIGVR